MNNFKKNPTETTTEIPEEKIDDIKLDTTEEDNENSVVNSEEYQTAYYNAAYLESYGGQILTENTISYLQKAYDAAPESEIADSILSTIQSIQAMNTESTTETTGEQQ